MDSHIAEEVEKITRILKEYGVSDRRIELMESLIENTAIIKAKLDDSKDMIIKSNIAIAYDNGGGQKGIRENPIFKGYEALWKSYMSGMDRIMSALPNEQAKLEVVEETKPQSMLELVRNKRKAT